MDKPRTSRKIIANLARQMAKNTQDNSWYGVMSAVESDKRFANIPLYHMTYPDCIVADFVYHDLSSITITRFHKIVHALKSSIHQEHVPKMLNIKINRHKNQSELVEYQFFSIAESMINKANNFSSSDVWQEIENQNKVCITSNQRTRFKEKWIKKKLITTTGYRGCNLKLLNKHAFSHFPLTIPPKVKSNNSSNTLPPNIDDFEIKTHNHAKKLIPVITETSHFVPPITDGFNNAFNDTKHHQKIYVEHIDQYYNNEQVKKKHCPRCTLINTLQSSYCEVCGMKL